MILRIWISMHSAFSTRLFLSGRRHRYITEVDIVVVRWYLSTYSSWFKSTNGANLPHERRLKYQPECHTSDVLLTAMNNRRGSHGQFSCLWSRTGASGENVSPPTAGLPSISVRKQHLFRFVSGRAACRYSKSRLQNVSRYYSRIWRRRANMKTHFIAHSRSYTKPKYLKSTTQMTHFSTLKSKCSGSFQEIRPWHFAYVIYVHLEGWPPGVFLFCFAAYVWCKEVQISYRIFTDKKYWKNNTER